MLPAGEKTELLAHVRDEITRDTDGSEIRTPATLGTYWASVRPLSGREFLAAQQTQSAVAWKVEMDYTAEIRQEDRFEWDGRVLQVVAVLPDKRDWVTRCMCSERNA